MALVESEENCSLKNENGSKFEKIVKTIFLALVWTCLGFYLEIYGPTQKDLKIRLHADYEEIALAVSGRSVGLFIGCLFSGVLVDKLGQFCDLFIAVSLNVAAVVTIIIPWASGIAVLWVCCTIGGIMETLINVSGQRLILNLWLEKSSAPMHLLHGGYGFGSLSVPLYSNPFLAVPMPTDTVTNRTNNSSCSTDMPEGSDRSSTELSTRYSKESRIEYAYAISAALVTALSIVFYYYQIRSYKAYMAKKVVNDRGTDVTAEKNGTINLAFDSKENMDTSEVSNEKPNEQMTSANNASNIPEPAKSPSKSNEIKSRSLRQMFNPATCTGGRLAYGIQLLVLLSFYFANSNGGERIAAGFVRSYSIDQLGFGGDEASLVNTCLWISHTAGRIAFFLAARWIGIRKLMLIETVGATTISVLLTIFGADYPIAYWVLLQPLGFFIAPLWPSMVAWADHHLELTGVGMTLFLCAGGIGGLVHMRLMGYLYEHLGPRTFLYQLTAYAVIAFLLTIVLTIVGAKHGNRFKWKLNEDEDELSVSKSAEKNTLSEKF